MEGIRLKLDEYQVNAYKTALYKQKKIYPALKLMGESGEITEKVGKILRDFDGDFDNPETKQELAKELGDVMWYVAAICTDYGVKLSEYAHPRKAQDVNKLYEGIDVIKMSARIAAQACYVMELIILSDITRMDNIIIQTGKMVELIQKFAHMIGYILEEIMDMNINKLSSRMTRGKIHGSGDNR
jgi:NTP pyrophosphatase (non-canonical NTP hydrolase)